MTDTPQAEPSSTANISNEGSDQGTNSSNNVELVQPNLVPRLEDSVQVPFYISFLWACDLIWTLVLLGMNVWEFLQKGLWAYQGPGSLIYFATLAAYAGAKETHQWTQGESQAELKGRKGILFVGVWVVFSMGTFVAVNLGKGYIFPHELLTITLEVLGIFFGTQASKALRQRRGIAAKAVGIEEGILRLAQETGGA